MPDEVRIFCNTCRRETRHNVLQIVEGVGDDNEILLWQIVQCAGCDTTSFYEEHRTEIEATWQPVGRVVYPTRLYKGHKDFIDLPDVLDQIYHEMIDAYNNASPILCAAGLRALVEGICADQAIVDGPKRDTNTGNYIINENGNPRRGKTLDCKIEGLAENGILTERQAGMLHEHRYLGNQALHELESPDQETLEIAIGILEHVMEDLYDMPAHLNDLIRQRLDR